MSQVWRPERHGPLHRTSTCLQALCLKREKESANAWKSGRPVIVALTRSLSLSLVEQGIRVNAVAPGPIWTPLIPTSFSAEEVRTFDSGTSKVSMLRAGQPCEAAPCYVLLASDDSSYMTGQVLHPNGGTIVGS